MKRDLSKKKIRRILDLLPFEISMVDEPGVALAKFVFQRRRQMPTEVIKFLEELSAVLDNLKEKGSATAEDLELLSKMVMDGIEALSGMEEEEGGEEEMEEAERNAEEGEGEAESTEEGDAVEGDGEQGQQRIDSMEEKINNLEGQLKSLSENVSSIVSILEGQNA